MFTANTDDLILRALQEDLGHGDITSNTCVPADALVQGTFHAKEDGVICGLQVAARVFQLLDASISFTSLVADGATVQTGDVIAEISGNARSILSGERVALNFLGHLSGIASKTAKAVAEVAGTGTKICDTRKTTPGLRTLEKYAVTMGGGYNHRFGLFDAVMIKDNHIIAAGGITAAVTAARKQIPHTCKVEVEAATFAEVEEAVRAGADIIMLDNMDVETMQSAVRHIAWRTITEASGNMATRPLREVAETGVDYISIGGLTHSAQTLDISLRLTHNTTAGQVQV